MEYDKIGQNECPIFLNQSVIKCFKCKNKIQVNEKSKRFENNWYHLECFEGVTKISHMKSDYTKKLQKSKVDPIQIFLTVTIFVFLTTTVYFILGTLSTIAMALGGFLLIYHLISARGKLYSKNISGNRGPSVFFLFLMICPFVIGTIVGYEEYSLSESPIRLFLLFSMTITFWATMLFIPLAVISRHKEDLIPESQHYPKISIIIPAHNEEKVIKQTINAAIESKYSNKEILLIDDGSTDSTLQIAMQYKDRITVLHKENGGKASAINYGLIYAKGEIIIVVDADTIIGRNSIKEIIKGFEINENVAAVAGNIKVKNRINIFTKVQALEYIVGIQVVRRAFDIFGAITIVPGALGAFRKSYLQEAGAYSKQTIVEDFDQTIKLLKAGLITQGSSKAAAYTEVPETIQEFIKQRKRWYRGNLQVIMKHSDVVMNPRFGNLQRIAFPYLMIALLITPMIGIVGTINAIVGVIQGDGWYVFQVTAIFATVHVLMAALAIRIDGEDPKLLWYVVPMIFWYKQMVDILLIRAVIEHAVKKKATWTSVKRTGSITN